MQLVYLNIDPELLPASTTFELGMVYQFPGRGYAVSFDGVHLVWYGSVNDAKRGTK